MVRKTRKQRGGALASLFRKKAPLSSQGNVGVNRSGNTVSYTRKGSLNTFVNVKKRKAIAAKSIRNHVKRLQSLEAPVRNEALSLMNVNVRTKTQTLLNQGNLNSLSNDQVLELYATGKVRSLSQ